MGLTSEQARKVGNSTKARAALQRKQFQQTQELYGKPLSIEQVRGSVPRSFRKHITEDFLDKLEDSLKGEDIANIIKENFLTYSNVLQGCDKNVNIWDYVNAVKFISYKIMGYSIDEAYKKVFPHKVETLIAEGKLNFINKYANSYNKNKIVNKIYEQTLIPSYVLNAPLFQRALNVLASMIENDEVRGMAKVKACEAILNYTKPPEIAKAEVTVNVQQSDAISDLREVAEAFAKNMRMSISDGKMSAQDIIDTKIIDVPAIEENTDGE